MSRAPRPADRCDGKRCRQRQPLAAGTGRAYDPVMAKQHCGRTIRFGKRFMKSRSWLIGLVGILIALFFAVATPAQTGLAPRPAEKFIIDDYEFTWKIVKMGKVTLSIEKTQDSNKVGLRDEDHSLWLLPADAEKVASALD